MSNSLETVKVPTGQISFDHSTCLMTATWNNGYTETWGKNGYSYETNVASFRNMVDSEMTYNEPLCEGPMQ